MDDSGSDGKDKLYGEDGDDVIFGNGNNDNIYGGNGGDLIFGNSGSTDKLYGNSGNDLIIASGGKKWSKRATVNGVRYVMDSDLDRAMGQANRRLSTSFKSTIKLSKNLNDKKDKLRSRAAALVDIEAFRYWLNKRNTNIHNVQKKK